MGTRTHYRRETPHVLRQTFIVAAAGKPCQSSRLGVPRMSVRAALYSRAPFAMLFKTLSAAVFGIDASIIEVEVDVSPIRSLDDHFNTVGLPDAAVRESRERIRAALKNSGYDIPPSNTTVNLAPADVKK